MKLSLFFLLIKIFIYNIYSFLKKIIYIKYKESSLIIILAAQNKSKHKHFSILPLLHLKRKPIQAFL